MCLVEMSNCGVQEMKGVLNAIARSMHKAILGSPFGADFASILASIYPAGGSLSSAALADPTFWRRLRVEVVEPLEGLGQAQAEEAAAGASEAQAAVDMAEALATRPCAHVRCTTLLGASEADAPRGKLCSGCRRVRYCGAACQKADWRAHRTACRELQRRKADDSLGLPG